MISGLANQQLMFIVMLMILTFAAICSLLICIVTQYKPIRSLAAALTEYTPSPGAVIDERTLLSSTFATLKDDSEQKQKFETAYREAQAANQAKSAFLSRMSHDIRTPYIRR